VKNTKSICLLSIVSIFSGCGGGGGGGALPPPPADDVLPPIVQSYSPLNESIDQSILTTFTVKFNEEVKIPDRANFKVEPYFGSTAPSLPCTRGVAKTTVDSNSPLNCPVGTSAISYGDDKSTLKFTPCGNLLENTRYRITLKDIGDTSGNKLVSPLVFEISTNKSPTVCSQIPIADSNHESLNPVIKITFSEGIKVSSLTSDGKIAGPTNFSMVETGAINPANIPIKVATLSLGDNKIVTLELDTPLTVNTNYTVTISGGQTGLKDMSDNAIVGNNALDYSWKFFAQQDVTAPTITSFYPLDGSTVSPYSGFQISFDEPMDVASLDPISNANSFKLFAIVNGNPIIVDLFDFSFKYDQASDSVVYTPKIYPALAENSSYRVIQYGAPSGASDTSSNLLAANKVINFTTSALPKTRNLTAAELVPIWFLLL